MSLKKKVGDLARGAKGELKKVANSSFQPDPDYEKDKITPDMRPMAAFLAAVVRSGMAGGRKRKMLLAIPVIPMLIAAWKEQEEGKTPRDKILTFLPLIPILIPALSSPLAIFVLAALHAQGVDKKIADSVEDFYDKMDKTTLRKISERVESISMDDLRALIQSLPKDGLKGMSQEEMMKTVREMGTVLKHKLRTGEPPEYPEEQKKDNVPPPQSPPEP